MKLKILFFAVVLLCFLSSGFAQVIEGRVLDKDTQLPLDGATVYIDGTTKVTITNAEGYFSINAENNASLVITYMGYSSSRLENLSQYAQKKVKVYLEKELNTLEEVVIGKSPFSRKEMMEVFRRQFLGTSRSASSCSIANEDDIILTYDVSDNTLHATARKTLKITNKYLQYEVNFDLIDFAVSYSRKSLSPFNVRQSYFAGSTFYRDLSKKGKSDKKRVETFLGSAPHLNAYNCQRKLGSAKDSDSLSIVFR